jgi:hypothetical protein
MMQTWVKDIKRIGIPEDGFRQLSKKLWQIVQASPLMGVFENLEE